MYTHVVNVCVYMHVCRVSIYKLLYQGNLFSLCNEQCRAGIHIHTGIYSNCIHTRMEAILETLACILCWSECDFTSHSISILTEGDV